MTFILDSIGEPQEVELACEIDFAGAASGLPVVQSSGSPGRKR
jgi:hypothetical protein